MIRNVVTSLIFGVAIATVAQTPVNNVKPTTDSKPPVAETKLVQNTPKTQVPQYTVVKPEDIKYGDTTIPGDSAVLAGLGKLAKLVTDYNIEENKLQQKYLPESNTIKDQIEKDIVAVKKANNWGDDVQFDNNSMQWVKLSPQAYENWKKSQSQSSTQSK